MRCSSQLPLSAAAFVSLFACQKVAAVFNLNLTGTTPNPAASLGPSWSGNVTVNATYINLIGPSFTGNLSVNTSQVLVGPCSVNPNPSTNFNTTSGFTINPLAVSATTFAPVDTASLVNLTNSTGGNTYLQYWGSQSNPVSILSGKIVIYPMYIGAQPVNTYATMLDDFIIWFGTSKLWGAVQTNFYQINPDGTKSSPGSITKGPSYTTTANPFSKSTSSFTTTAPRSTSTTVNGKVVCTTTTTTAKTTATWSTMDQVASTFQGLINKGSIPNDPENGIYAMFLDHSIIITNNGNLSLINQDYLHTSAFW